MKLTEVMSNENAATLRALFARYHNELKDMDMHERRHTPNGIFASSAYDTLFLFMENVHYASEKSEIVRSVLNDLNSAWNKREKWDKRYIESGDETHLEHFHAYTVEVITLQMLVGYVTR